MGTVPRIWIEQLEFSNGKVIGLNHDDIIVLVGPNNSGKTTTLRDIRKHIEGPQKSKAISKISVGMEGNEADLLAWFKATVNHLATANGTQFLGLNNSIMEKNVSKLWKEGSTTGFGSLTSFFCLLADTDQRLAITTPAANDVNMLEEQPKHPAQFLLADDTLEAKLSKAFEKAFGEELILYRNAGSKIPLLVGRAPKKGSNEDRVSASYLKKLAMLPKLHEQGDGMRGFAAVLMVSLVRQYSMLLLDEPSVFLHPPQARILGKSIVENAAPNTQIIMATHDGDFLRGLLDIGSKRVKVIRLQRKGDATCPSVLNNQDIGDVWGNSLLKHSNVLDALFHEVALLCESDADALFYAVLVETVFEIKKLKKPDAMYVHAGGKDRFPLLAKALKKLNVP